jgi:hypothetical protein
MLPAGEGACSCCSLNSVVSVPPLQASPSGHDQTNNSDCIPVRVADNLWDKLLCVRDLVTVFAIELGTTRTGVGYRILASRSFTVILY